MEHCIKSPNRSQRGDALIEAMVGVVLTAVISLGLSHATARAVSSQRFLNTQNIVVTKVRETLANSDDVSVKDYCACTAKPSVTVGGHKSDMTMNCPQAAVAINLAPPVSPGGSGRDKSKNNQGSRISLPANIPANTMVTSMNVGLQANESNAALVGGNGAMGVAF
jgi:prepilin peptidase dependent protein A